jgi:cold shock protein
MAGKIPASDSAAVVDSVEQRRAMEEYRQRFHGTMHTWSGKRYGFIRRDDKQPDVFAHISDVMEFMGDQLEVGQRVTFELGQDPKSGKTKAVNVRIS